MLACATVPPGVADLFQREIQRLGASPVADELDHRGVTSFEVPGPSALVDVLRDARITHRVGPVLASGRVDPDEPWSGLRELVEAIDVDPWFSGGPFAVRAHRHGEHAFTSMDVAAHVGDVLHDHLEAELGTRPKVDLDEPDAILRVHLDGAGRTRLWLDLVGPASLHRRGYRVYDHRAGMKPSLACALFEMLDWQGAGAFADPMAGGGTLVAEAAWKACSVSPVALRDDLLVENVPCLPALDAGGLAIDPQACPKLVWGDHARNHLDGAQANLEAAGLEGCVDFYVDRARALPEHVENADVVAVNPSYGIRSSEEGELEKSYRELLQAADAALADDGRLGLMTPLVELVRKAAHDTRLSVRESREVMHGGLDIELIVLG